MATTWLNSAEGTNGNVVSTSDTYASDQPWTSGFQASGQYIKYNNSIACHGLTSHEHTNTTGGGAYVTWSSFPSATTIYSRVYLYMSAIPSGNTRIISYTGASGTLRAAMFIQSDGTVSVNTAPGSQMTAIPTALQTGKWYRIETKVVGSATVGGAQLKVFPQDSTTPISDTTSTFNFDTGGAMDEFRWGNYTGTNGVTYYLDDYGISDVGFIGPVPFSGQSVGPATDITTTGWTATGGTGTLSSAIDEAVFDDSDYVSSPATPSSSVFETKLNSFTLPTQKTAWSVDYRIRSANAATSTVVVGLYQNTTLIASETRTNVPNTFTTYTLYLTNAQATNVTDGTNLRLRFTVTAS